ncbi:MAG: DUF115 domain-containing protein [Archaeoglobaceae archaeon]|nr:DUF115 domain-containing protein [Archaeoglobaceae archaeon]MCX8151724.1 DUF115 domain-containing protein [Archaeoglobaceae archaeon]MDW8013853.1 DUF115 domain-containing protein [Archaeoglobaceae archaeon]
MELSEWMKLYQEIVKDLGFNRRADEKAAKIVYEIAKDKLLDSSVLEVLRGKDVAVVGGAYEGEKIEEDFIISAGKAVKKLKNLPNIHVTDAEEDDELLLDLLKKGCILVIHVHGDNVERLLSLLPKLEKFVATTQSYPFDKVYNFTGFTDGDRAAIIAKRFGARKIKLYGFNFEKADGVKLKKLKWAKKILEIEGLI